MNYHIIAFRVRDITNFGRGVILFFSLLYKKNASTDICKITNVKICTLFDSSSINLQILFLFYIRFNTISFNESSGFVEGNNNKFKLIKRILYGRCNLVNLFKKCFSIFSLNTSNNIFELLNFYSSIPNKA